MDLERLLEKVGSDGRARIRHLWEGNWRGVSAPEVVRQVRETMRRLRGWGVGRGSRVGIQATNSLEWLIHDLALIELGAISVAIADHVGLTVDEIAERFDLNFLLVSSDLHGELVRPWMGFIDRQSPGAKALRAAPAGHSLGDGVLTLALSSGTSGVLKTLIIKKAGVEALIEMFARRFPMVPADRVLLFLPMYTMQQRMIAFGALWYGLELIISSPPALFRSLKEAGPTIIIGPPLLYESIERRYLAAVPRWLQLTLNVVAAASRLFPARIRRALLRRLFAPIHAGLGKQIRWMVTGMAHIRLSTLRFFRRVGLPLYEAYGLTECGMVCANSPEANRLGSVGRPFQPGSVSLAPDGEIIVRRDPLLASGYWRHDPHEARQVFLDHETVATGDLGRFDAEGYLYITGRKKALIVTSGGAKIQPETLENTIRDCPGVEQCAIVGSESLPFLTAIVRMIEGTGRQETDRVEQALAVLNRGLPSGAEIRRTIWSDVPFSADNGLLTKNLKLDRTRIAARFVEQPETGHRGRRASQDG